MLIFPPRPEDFKFAEAKSPQLRIVTYSDASRIIVVRGLTKTGLIHDTYDTTADRLIQTRIISLTEIPLTILVETHTTLVQRGQLYCQLFLEVAGVPAATLAADYITTGSPLAWPGGQIRAATDGRGALLASLQYDPDPEYEIVLVVPQNTLWRLISFRYRLNTSSAAGTRVSTLLIRTPSDEDALRCTPSLTQGPSSGISYWYSDFGYDPLNQGGHAYGYLPNVYLHAGGSLKTDTTNMQANDNYASLVLAIEEWLNP